MRTHSFSPTPIAWLEAWSEEAIAHWKEYLSSDNAQTGSSYVENGSNVCEQTGRHTHWNDHGDAKAPMYSGCFGRKLRFGHLF
jgi:hypothetical protein